MQKSETGSQPERRISARTEMLNAADAILKANPEPRTSVRIRYRGGRPVFNWHKKQDQDGAAALWMVARSRIPQAANDNLPTEAGLHADRSRKDGRPRGANRAPVGSLAEYLALPTVAPRLGDAEHEPTLAGNWDGRHRGITVKPQRQRGDYPMYPFGKFIDAEMTVAAHCQRSACNHSQLLDLHRLRERFGPDMPAMRDDLAPWLRCARCGGKEVGLTFSPKSNEARR